MDKDVSDHVTRLLLHPQSLTPVKSKDNVSSGVDIDWLVSSPLFRGTVLVTVLLNCLLAVLQTYQYLDQQYSALFVALDRLFLTVFVLEMMLKWYNDFIGFWRDAWNVLNTVIISILLLGTMLTLPTGSRWFILFRVLRALLSLYCVKIINGIGVIFNTVLHTLPSVAKILMLLFITMFIFAVLGQSLFGGNCQRSFGSLGATMFTLFVCVTQDGWVDVTMELNECGYSILGALYLVSFVTLGAFVFSNLVVAVVVTNLYYELQLTLSLKKKPKSIKPIMEWALSMQKQSIKSTPSNNVTTAEVENNFSSGLDPKQLPPSIPLLTEGNSKKLEKYFEILKAQENNLIRFNHLKEQIYEIYQEIKVLTTADDISVEGSVGAVSHTHHTPPPDNITRRRFSSLSFGDAVSNLISMSQGHSKARSRSNTLAQIISSLPPSTHHAHSILAPHTSHTHSALTHSRKSLTAESAV